MGLKASAYSSAAIRAYATKFSKEKFQSQVKSLTAKHLREFQSQQRKNVK
jgi:hypothetical protein